MSKKINFFTSCLTSFFDVSDIFYQLGLDHIMAHFNFNGMWSYSGFIWIDAIRTGDSNLLNDDATISHKRSGREVIGTNCTVNLMKFLAGNPAMVGGDACPVIH